MYGSNKKGAADSEFSNSLKLMQSSYEQLQNILSYKETPLSYLRISILYSIPLIGLIYALYHTAKLNVKFFILGFVLTIAAGIGAFVNFGKIEIGLLAVVTSISIWAIISLIVDIQRRRKFISSREIWKKLQPHPQLEAKSEIFSGLSDKVTATFSWILPIPFIFLICVPILFYNDIMKHQEDLSTFNSKISYNQLDEKDSAKVTVDKSAKKDAAKVTVDKPAEKDAAKVTVDKSAEKDAAKVIVDKPAEKDAAKVTVDKTAEKDAAKVTVDKPAEKNKAENEQAEAMETLVKFHEYITRKEYKKAYDCYCQKLRNSSNYQKWSEGFKTTVSSKVSNLEIVGASNDEYTIKFNLEAVDNPGGTRNFNGTAVITKENNAWKIYSVNHKRIN